MNYEIPKYSDNALSCFYKNEIQVFQADFALQSGCIISDGWGDIDENSINSKIFIYPVPTYGMIEIKNESGNSIDLKIIDLSGRVALSFSLHNFSSKELNISDLSNGLYFVQIISVDNPISYKRIIKM